MASKKAKSDTEAVGPTQDGQGGYGPTVNPPNPQDRIFSGPLPTISSPGMTTRRPFSEVTRPPLHYSDGGGPDESDVTSRRPMVYAPTDNRELTLDHCEDRPAAGIDPNKYSTGPDNSRTTNGVEIRGT